MRNVLAFSVGFILIFFAGLASAQTPAPCPENTFEVWTLNAAIPSGSTYLGNPEKIGTQYPGYLIGVADGEMLYPTGGYCRPNQERTWQRNASQLGGLNSSGTVYSLPYVCIADGASTGTTHTAGLVRSCRSVTCPHAPGSVLHVGTLFTTGATACLDDCVLAPIDEGDLVNVEIVNLETGHRVGERGDSDTQWQVIPPPNTCGLNSRPAVSPPSYEGPDSAYFDAETLPDEDECSLVTNGGILCSETAVVRDNEGAPVAQTYPVRVSGTSYRYFAPGNNANSAQVSTTSGTGFVDLDMPGDGSGGGGGDGSGGDDGDGSGGDGGDGSGADGGDGSGGDGGDGSGDDSEGVTGSIPVLDSAPTFSETLSEFMSRVNSSPVVASVTDITLPSGGTCPKGNLPLFGKTHVMESHCTLIETATNFISAFFIVMWSLTSVFIFLRA